MTALGILALCGLVLSLGAAAGVLAASRSPGARRPFLALVFVEAALYFLAELIGSVAGRNPISLALNFGSALYSLPSLYFYVAEFEGERRERVLRHYAPAIANAFIGTAIAISAAADGYRAGPAAAFYLVGAQLGQTAQLVLYGRAAYSTAAARARSGASPWPKRVILSAILGYGGFLVISWVVFGFSLASEILDRRVAAPEGLDSSSLVLSLLFAWTCGLCAIWGREAAGARAEQKAEAGPKYGGRRLPEGERSLILERLGSLLGAEPDLASPAVEPRRLAARLGVPYYLLSMAVNEGSGRTISELVNDYRIERAKELLVRRPELGVLEVALEAGFQAKSTFNEVFKRATGMSPREYRAGAGEGGSVDRDAPHE